VDRYPENGTGLYLDLMKKVLINEIDLENKLRSEYIQECLSCKTKPDLSTARDIRLIRRERYNRLRSDLMDGRYRLQPDSSHYPFTLIGRARLDNIQACLDRIRLDNIPGDCIEAGVWRGGSTIFMRAYLKAFGIRDRKVWLADSFEGLPMPGHTLEKDYDFYAYDVLSVCEELVRHNFEVFDLLDDQVCFLKGWFKETLPSASIDSIALLRLDGDMFESTLDSLTALYPRLSPGGFVIVDDYGTLDCCRHAVHAYRARHRIKTPIEKIDHTGVYWRKDAI
jgi:O-methyltransferase